MAIAFAVEAQTNKGAEQMMLAGGKQGSVPFPHHRHQTALGDCMRCHTLFSQEKGGIAKAQSEGKLVVKQVMNTMCIQCHRERKQAGQPGGPVTCAQCHVKE
ncbi:MAG: cytochrome c3 family protein [Desulfatitalea sp.]